MLIKYAHVLICISAGEGFQHFSAISLYRGTSNSDTDYLRKYSIYLEIITQFLLLIGQAFPVSIRIL